MPPPRLIPNACRDLDADAHPCIRPAAHDGPHHYDEPHYDARYRARRRTVNPPPRKDTP
jgi:hypothetical protein